MNDSENSPTKKNDDMMKMLLGKMSVEETHAIADIMSLAIVSDEPAEEDEELKKCSKIIQDSIRSLRPVDYRLPVEH